MLNNMLMEKYMLMETDKKYNNFAELYADYKDIIDAEFRIRHHFRLTQLKDSLENREKWEHSYISMFNKFSENDVSRSAIDVLDDIYSAVMKEIEMPIPMDVSIDEEIKKYKNKIVDILYKDTNEPRGSKNYQKRIYNASLIADLFESGIRSAYYDSHINEIRKTNELFDELFDEQSKIRKQYLKNYHENTYGEFSKIMDILTHCPVPYKDTEKEVSDTQIGIRIIEMLKNMDEEQIKNVFKNEKE